MTRVRQYSGSFNIRTSSETDIAAIAEMVRGGGVPLQDIAHFIWTRNDESPELRDLPSIAPRLSAELETHNPYFQAAWTIFGLEFNKHLVMPNHRKLWAEGYSRETLPQEEKEVFDAAEACFNAGDVRSYCKAIAEHESLLAKVVKYKRSTLSHLATDTLDGPLCDCLVFLSAYAEQHTPALLTFEKTGIWSVDFNKGFTGIVKEGQLCPAVQPSLVEGKAAEAAKLLGAVLQNAVLDAVAVDSAKLRAMRGSTCGGCWPGI